MAAEQDWRALLIGVDLSGLAALEKPGAGRWTSREDILNSPQVPERRYTFSNGVVNVDLAADPYITALIWDAKLPDCLIPGSGLDNYMVFKDLALSRFPSILFPKTQPVWQYTEDYQDDSFVEIIFKNGDQKGYRFAHEKADKELAIDYVTRGDEIQSVLITGKTLPLFEEYQYMLRFEIHSGDEAEMALIVRNRGENLIAWNPYAMDWVLGTHKEKDRLREDLLREGTELSYLVTARAEEVLGLKPIPQTSTSYLDTE